MRRTYRAIHLVTYKPHSIAATEFDELCVVEWSGAPGLVKFFRQLTILFEVYIECDFSNDKKKHVVCLKNKNLYNCQNSNLDVKRCR